MTARQNNKMRMYLSIKHYCSKPENQAAVAKILAFEKEYQGFQSVSEKILNEAMKQQGSISVGVTEDKDQIRAIMADQASRVAAAVQTWADVTDDLIVFAAVNHTRYDFLAGREIDAANRAEIILTIATSKLGLLGDYGVDQAVLDDLDAVIGRFSAAIGKPRGTIIDRKTATASLPLLFTRADKHLARLDRLAKLLEVTHSEFVLGYRNARLIVTKRGGQTAVVAAAASTAAPAVAPIQPVLLPSPVADEFINGEEVTEAA